MSGTKAGAAKATAKIIEKFGEDYFAIQGSKGGKAPYKGKKGFAANPELASRSGRKGGTISRRGRAK